MIKKMIGCLAVLFLCLFIGHAYAEDISFSIDDVHINAKILDNGDMQVSEQFTYDIDHFNGMLRTINTNGSDGIGNFSAKEISPNQKELQFEATEHMDSTEYKIFRPADNETVTFQLDYTLKNVAVKYKDTASLYWKFFDESNTSSFNNLTIQISLPQKADQTTTKIFAHDQLHSTIQFQNDGSILYNVGSLPMEEMTEVRILFPTDWIPSSSKIDLENVEMKQKFIDQELNWAKETERQQHVSNIFNAIDLIYAVLIIIVVVYVYKKFDKERKTEKIPYFRELPSDISPAIVSYLMNSKTVSAKSISAIMLDFVRRGILTMEEIEPDGMFSRFKSNNYKFTIANNFNTLSKQESFLFNWFIEDLGDNESFTIHDIKKHANSHPNTFQKKYKDWTDLVKEEAESYHFFEDDMKKKGKFMLFGFFGIILAFITLTKFESFTAIFLLPLSVLSIIYIGLSKRKTQQGIDEYEKWKGFKRYLTDFSKMDEQPVQSIVLWEHYLVYAVSLDVAKEVMKQIQIYIPQMNDVHHSTYLYSNSNDSFNQNFDVDSFSDFENSMNSAFSPPSSGSGGGSSSGGGGGGGGGGAGGF